MIRPRSAAALLAVPSLVVPLLVVPLLVAPLLVAAAAPASAEVGRVEAAVADSGAKVVRETVIDARTVDLTVRTASVGTTTVRLLLPKGWGADPDLRYPTLYMYHGIDEPEDYRSWTHFTDVEGFMRDKDVLVVLPSAGLSTSYTDEYRFMRDGPRWETYHTTELPQIIERGYRSNGVNAVAGLSSGGYGGLVYAARHPGLFRAVAAYSAMTDTLDPGAILSRYAVRVAQGTTPNPYGPILLDVPLSIAHNPQSMPERYRGIAIYLSCGGGQPGPFDDEVPTVQDRLLNMAIEAAAQPMNLRFAETLRAAGVTPTTNFYPAGLHYWPYWEREFTRSYPVLAAALGAPTRASEEPGRADESGGAGDPAGDPAGGLFDELLRLFR